MSLSVVKMCEKEKESGEDREGPVCSASCRRAAAAAPMDRSWIGDANHISTQYLDGVRAFLDFAFKDRNSDASIYCPCTSCENRITKSRRDILLHCIRYGLDQSYKCATAEDTGPGPSNAEPLNDKEDEHIHHDSKGYRKMLEDVLCHWSNKSIDLLLELLRDALPDDVVLPKNFYEANKITKDLGFTCKTIHACINNCMLFIGEDVHRDACVVYGEKRFTQGKDRSPVKQLRYFPLIPRLQRWFLSSKTASSIRWHAKGRVDDGKMRHLADSPAWKGFDHRYPTFAEDIHNVRLGLATDDGPQGPGDRIDVFLQPLMDELKELWYDGVRTYDARSKEDFQMRATLLWTISDFPGYGMLSGWPTREANACPVCGVKTHSRYLKVGHKYSYCGHRRFLPSGHRMRYHKHAFDGMMDFETKPSRLTSNELHQQFQDVRTEYCKVDLIQKVVAQ
ncbi:uncharacterized protein LOC127251232 [Andrographis paniculata]|uniref:uncharacterized protein LOC127251232 n=1 Tax=Andrographis paniculata TaxID=175694 RepID=UPI0021E994E7|nr:uncharacterized protein LOC127251232 [Andrographis paniculata]